MPDVHARLSASGSKKWINCPSSVSMEEKFPDTTSDYASEGTTAHSLGELKIKLSVGEISRVGFHKSVDTLAFDADMQDYTDDYEDFVVERFNAIKSTSPNAILLVEHRLDFSKYVPGGFGTGDAVIVGNGILEIIDLKYGKGVTVSATENSQLMLYALGGLLEFDWLYSIEKVRMTIFQPRIDNIDTYEMSARELYLWGEWVSMRADLANRDNNYCCAGKHCDEGFCKARAVCRAYNEEKQKLAYLDFKPPNELTDDEIAEVLDNADSLVKWAKTVNEYALDMAVNKGVKYPGFKLVEGRSNRTYTDDTAVINKIIKDTDFKEEDITTKKLKGITEMEKLLGKKQFGLVLGDLVIKPQGKPTLVHTEDKRPEINTSANAVDDFKNLIIK